jgi:hypothetical protein
LTDNQIFVNVLKYDSSVWDKLYALVGVGFLRGGEKNFVEKTCAVDF